MHPLDEATIHVIAAICLVGTIFFGGIAIFRGHS